MAVAPSTPSTGTVKRSPVIGGGSGSGGRKSPTRLSGSNTPFKQSIRKSPSKKSPGGNRGNMKSPSGNNVEPEQKDVKPKEEKDDTASSGHSEAFDDHSEFCKRMAKTLYFANKLPSTPRPSLPLTMLAVNTFASTARKDTLEFLDVEMAAEIGRNACVSPTALILAIIYLERMSSQNPGYLNYIKPSELFVVSLLVASKFIQDDGEDLGIFNDEWATSANMDLKALNRLELQFLCAIDWNINVKSDEFNTVFKRLENKLALHQGTARGWFTYTEMTNLDSPFSWNTLWPTLYDHCVKVIVAAYVTYATVLATVLTSSILAPQLFVFYKGVILASLSSLQSFQTSICLREQPTTYNMSLPVHYNNRDLTFNHEPSDLEIDMDFLEMDSLVEENETDFDSGIFRPFIGKIGTLGSHAFINHRRINANNDIISPKNLIMKENNNNHLPISLKNDDDNDSTTKTDISSILLMNNPNQYQKTVDTFIHNFLRTMGTCQADCLLTSTTTSHSQQFCTRQDSIPCIVI